jgi:hypothetical protein
MDHPIFLVHGGIGRHPLRRADGKRQRLWPGASRRRGCRHTGNGRHDRHIGDRWAGPDDISVSDGGAGSKNVSLSRHISRRTHDIAGNVEHRLPIARSRLQRKDEQLCSGRDDHGAAGSPCGRHGHEHRDPDTGKPGLSDRIALRDGMPLKQSTFHGTAARARTFMRVWRGEASGRTGTTKET